MALPKSALNDLLNAIRAGGDIDVIRSGMQLVLQELIELEAAGAIGAARYERAEGRLTHRNGSRGRLLSTKAGDVVRPDDPLRAAGRVHDGPHQHPRRIGPVSHRDRGGGLARIPTLEPDRALAAG